MRNSLILGMISSIYKKLAFYYRNSGFFQVLQRMGQSFGKYTANSCILGFFDREWNIGRAWKGSYILRILILPLRLFKYISDKLSHGTNSALEDSRALSGISGFLEGLFIMNSRVYGLLLLTFAVTQGLLDIAFGNGDLMVGIREIINLVLFLLGTMLILINRPVKSLVEGSLIGRIAYDFFIVRRLKDGTDDNV